MPKIAIIGAGASGLTSAASAIKEGLEPAVFEMSDRIGGVWGPDTRNETDQGTAWPNMRVNISRHTGTFSDFSWPQNTHDFPTTQEVYSYLCDYVKHHKLEPCLRFSSKVIQVFPQGKKWIICYQKHQDIIREEHFDFIIVASSKFSMPYMPKFKGMEKLQKKMLHSSKY